MTLREKLLLLLKTSLKKQDKQTLQFARNLQAAVQKKEIDTRTKLQDSDIEALAFGLLKQRKESLFHFEKAKRSDLIVQEKAEIAFLQQFVPTPLSQEEIEKQVQAAIKQTGAQNLKDLGKVMGYLMSKLKGKVDGKIIQQIVRDVLKNKETDS